MDPGRDSSTVLGRSFGIFLFRLIGGEIWRLYRIVVALAVGRIFNSQATFETVSRILDLDLDFFVHGAAHWRVDGNRLDPDEFPPWDTDQAISFLRERCCLDAALPGFVVENHGELFALWKEAIQNGRLKPPFHVTHVDAHADLGLGDSGYVHLMTDVLYREPKDRLEPREGQEGLDDGNFLAFCIACHWISDLAYVYNDEGGNDLLSYHMEGFDPMASHIQLKAMRKQEINKLVGLLARSEDIQVDRFEPLVPFRHGCWREFQADRPFDFICLTRSPPFTPVEADVIFDEIRRRFIDEALG
jgi:hypothetical protein